jgi:hypothetical protein
VSSDEAAVFNLMGRYCHAMDDPDQAAVLDCFTEDGAFVYYKTAEDDEPLFRADGHDGIGAWFVHHRATTPFGAMTHVTVNIQVEIDGDEGRAVSTYTSLRARDGGIAIGSTGRNHDHVVRGTDGVWRIKERVCRGDMPRAGI